CYFISLLLMIRPPPSSPVFPYTTLFRSLVLRSIVRRPGACRMREEERAPEVAVADAQVGVALKTERLLVPGAPLRDLVGVGECRSEEHTSELQSRGHLVCRLLLEKKNRE